MFSTKNIHNSIYLHFLVFSIDVELYKDFFSANNQFFFFFSPKIIPYYYFCLKFFLSCPYVTKKKKMKNNNKYWETKRKPKGQVHGNKAKQRSRFIIHSSLSPSASLCLKHPKKRRQLWGRKESKVSQSGFEMVWLIDTQTKLCVWANQTKPNLIEE